jgi:uncharacterized protein YukE
MRLLEVAISSLTEEWSAIGADEFAQVFAQYRASVLAGVQAVELLAAGVMTAGSTYEEAEAAVHASTLVFQAGS